MTGGSVDEALIAYKKVHRALLTSTASRWRHLDISMQQLRAIYLLRDEEVATVGARESTAAPEKKGVDRAVLAVFAGLMLGSLIASLNLTLVAPALPTIVAELGGIADYSWIPISAMLASTIVVPIAGKLSDIYGRKPLYMTAIVVF